MIILREYARAAAFVLERLNQSYLPASGETKPRRRLPFTHLAPHCQWQADMTQERDNVDRVVEVVELGIELGFRVRDVGLVAMPPSTAAWTDPLAGAAEWWQGVAELAEELCERTFKLGVTRLHLDIEGYNNHPPADWAQISGGAFEVRRLHLLTRPLREVLVGRMRSVCPCGHKTPQRDVYSYAAEAIGAKWHVDGRTLSVFSNTLRDAKRGQNGAGQPVAAPEGQWVLDAQDYCTRRRGEAGWSAARWIPQTCATLLGPGFESEWGAMRMLAQGFSSREPIDDWFVFDDDPPKFDERGKFRSGLNWLPE